VTTQSDLPQFGPEEADGFRSFSLYTDTGASIRVSLNFDVIHDYLSRTAGDLNLYSDAERESLKTAAKLLAAKTPDELLAREQLDSDQLIDLAQTELLQSATEITIRSIEKWYPHLARLALQAVSDACVKRSLNIVSQGLGAPSVTTGESVDIILADFCETIRAFLNRPGRPLESAELIRHVQEAVERLKAEHPRQKPTQEKVAEILGIEPRTLRARLATCHIKWSELLRLCGWKRGTKFTHE